MWRHDKGWFECKIQKSIRIDDYTFNVIDSYHGRSFSDKLRNYVFDVEHHKKVAPNCNT